MEKRNIQFWVQFYTFPDGDRLSREEEYPFFDDEIEFAETMDDRLLEWLKKHKDFGLKEYGWKLISPE